MHQQSIYSIFALLCYASSAPTSSPEQTCLWEDESDEVIAVQLKPQTRIDMRMYPSQQPSAQQIERAHKCLQLTTPGLRLKYPDDPETHFQEIHDKLKPWLSVRPYTTAAYNGTKIEDLWVSRSQEAMALRPEGDKLVPIFGPYIPLLVPWGNIWYKDGKRRYPHGFIDSLLSVLRPDVPYITVNRLSNGLPAHHCDILMEWVPNLLVLSAGGYGHVALPLINQPERIKRLKPISQRTYLVSYVGSMAHDPVHLREDMGKIVQQKSKELGFQTYCGVVGDEMPANGPVAPRDQGWKRVMADTRVSLCPRGYGRTAFHLYEVLQSGLIPIHIYTDIPWVAYPHIFERIGYVVNLMELPALLGNLSTTSSAELEKREELALQYRDSHFSLLGTVNHIDAFMTNGGGDLRCMPLPSTIRDSPGHDMRSVCPSRPRPIQYIQHGK
mmetsp:Transcript_94434/g.243888  ORF Transcript_94434/g.243888 Transcript_94434/m.243888 type:complete len:441 (-) Transcript_94434:86-1408(-)